MSGAGLRTCPLPSQATDVALEAGAVERAGTVNLTFRTDTARPPWGIHCWKSHCEPCSGFVESSRSR